MKQGCGLIVTLDGIYYEGVFMQDTLTVSCLNVLLVFALVSLISPSFSQVFVQYVIDRFNYVFLLCY